MPEERGEDIIGIKGERFSGIYIKDMWTKPKQGRIKSGNGDDRVVGSGEGGK